MDSPVRSRSNHTYAQQPYEVFLEGRWYPVTAIIATWKEPAARGFRLLLTDFIVVDVRYREDTDTWDIVRR